MTRLVLLLLLTIPFPAKSTEILLRHLIDGRNSLWTMDGITRESETAISSVPDQNWEVAGMGDFNGNGSPDILWRNTLDGSNAIWLMNGSTVQSTQFIPPVADTNWEIMGISDFDKDGKDDILWSYALDGRNAEWLMNGFSVKTGAFIPDSGDINWAVVGVRDMTPDYSGFWQANSVLGGPVSMQVATVGGQQELTATYLNFFDGHFHMFEGNLVGNVARVLLSKSTAIASMVVDVEFTSPTTVTLTTVSCVPRQGFSCLLPIGSVTSLQKCNNPGVSCIFE